MDRRISARDVLETMRARSGRSADSVSTDLHRTRNWLRRLAGGDPMLSTVAAVASVTGCEVVIRDRETGETVAVIDAPDPEQRKRQWEPKSGTDTSQSSPEAS